MASVHSIAQKTSQATSQTTAVASPWYRQRWPWFVIAPPAVAVIGGSITIAIAVLGADGVVAADHYKQGLQINRQLDRQAFAAALGLEAHVFDLTASTPKLQLRSTQPLAAVPELQLHFVHPAHAAADRLLRFTLVSVSADGHQAQYVAQAAAQWTTPLAPGVKWQLVLETPQWRLNTVSLEQPATAAHNGQASAVSN